MTAAVSPWVAAGLTYLAVSALFTIAWCLSGIGTPDDHELEGDR